MEPDVVYEPPSPEVIQKIKDDIAERNAQDVAKPPPPGASPNGHWHDGVWHNEPHNTHKSEVVPNEVDAGYLQQLQTQIDAFISETPPPYKNLRANPQARAAWDAYITVLTPLKEKVDADRDFLWRKAKQLRRGTPEYASIEAQIEAMELISNQLGIEMNARLHRKAAISAANREKLNAEYTDSKLGK